MLAAPSPTKPSQTSPQAGLLFYLSADHGFKADYAPEIPRRTFLMPNEPWNHIEAELRYKLTANVEPNNPSLEPLVKYINGRFSPDERMTMVTMPPVRRG